MAKGRFVQLRVETHQIPGFCHGKIKGCNYSPLANLIQKDVPGYQNFVKMSLSKLKLNPEKTEFIVFGSKAQGQKISSHFPVNIIGSLLHPIDSVRNLGVWFNAQFSFSEHVKRTCKVCFIQMHDLHRIKQYLTPEVAVLAANALVSSRLDYCNSLFRGLSCLNQRKLQSIQNTIARTVTNRRKYAHVTPILKQLHCIFKTATLVYQFLHSGSPSYFQPFISLSSCSNSTRRSHPCDRWLLAALN